MNYRHAFHAGNFADVHKHTVLARILVRLCEKSTPLRVLDTHAGTGVYDLAGEEPSRTGEWREGIGRLWSADIPDACAALLAPYLEAVRTYNADGELRVYPGSPLIARLQLRRQDRLVACELHPVDAKVLADNVKTLRGTKAIAIDGWTALQAYIPFPERRGLVLIDPPFERPDEFERLFAALSAAHAKWPTGVYMAWFPLKDERAVQVFVRRLAESAIPKVLASDLLVCDPAKAEGLSGSGIVVINPPWRLADDLAVLGPTLSDLLRQGAGAQARMRWLTGEP